MPEESVSHPQAHIPLPTWEETPRRAWRLPSRPLASQSVPACLPPMTSVHSMSHCPVCNRHGISTRVKVVTYGWVLCYEKANGAFLRETE